MAQMTLADGRVVGLGWRGKTPPGHYSRRGLRTFDPDKLKLKVTALPAAFDLSKYVSFVWNQGGVGSCVGHAAVQAYTIRQNIVNNNNPAFVQLSPMFVYDWARIHDGSFPNDVGTYISSGAYAMATDGVASEQIWPDGSLPTVLPSAAADADGKTRTLAVNGYVEVPYSGAAQVTAIKQNLFAGYPVYDGFACYNSFGNSGQYIPIPPAYAGDNYRGGHAGCFVGWNDTLTATTWGQTYTGWFKKVNSWGTGFGAGGFYWVPYAWFNTFAEYSDTIAIQIEIDPLPSEYQITLAQAASMRGSLIDISNTSRSVAVPYITQSQIISLQADVASIQAILNAVTPIAPSTATLVCTPNPSVYQTPVTLTATVTGASPTGNVSFTSNGVALGPPVTLVSGVASMVTSSLAGGVDSIVATYSGDANNAGSSASVTETVTGGPGPQPSPAGTTVPPAASITDNAGGVWTLGNGGYPGGQAILLNGSQAAGGSAVKILWDGVTITVLNNSNHVYKWTGSTWLPVS